jgi:hypothetical protein
VLYVAKARERIRIEREEELERREKAESEARAHEYAMKAHVAGANFVTSRDLSVTDEQLFARFRGDDKVYNVVYTRNYKDVHGRSQFAEKVMDKNRTNIQETGTAFTRDSVQIKKGQLNDGTTIMVARRAYAPEPGNAISEGGEILVVVYAVKLR